jgi:serine/threonine protein kinase
VWLCHTEAVGDFRALKILSTKEPERLEREFQALCQFRAASHRLKHPSLLTIEHVNRTEDTLYYVMPLCDGVEACAPSDAQWRPLSLRTLIEQQKQALTWFSTEAIRETLLPIFQALQLLSDAGLAHRDVKPDNILFVDGKACLADIGLLSDDLQEFSRTGTPGFAAPSWYLDSGGHPDMYGAAATLYVMLTGNAPDKIGRSAFRWPPQGEESLGPEQHKEFLHLHRLIRRAMDERPGERFADFATFERALRLESSFDLPSLKIRYQKRLRRFALPGIIGTAALLGLIKFGKDHYQLLPQETGHDHELAAVEAFNQTFRQLRDKVAPPRESIRKTIGEVVSDLKTIIEAKDIELPKVAQQLAQIHSRVNAVAKDFPAKSDWNKRREAIEQLRSHAHQAVQSSSPTLREHINGQIRDLESEFFSEADFRAEQAKRFMPLAIKIMNDYSVASSPRATYAMILNDVAKDKAGGSKKAIRDSALSIYRTGQEWMSGR